MMCSQCKTDQDRGQFGPSAENWVNRRMCKACENKRSQVKRHGLSKADREAVAAHQGGCRICGHAEPGSKGWIVDHDHACCDSELSCTKCRRGVICSWCNLMLGYAFDRVHILEAAIRYLNAPRTCDWHMPVACDSRLCDSKMHVRDGTDATHVDELKLTGNPSVPSRAGAHTEILRGYQLRSVS